LSSEFVWIIRLDGLRDVLSSVIFLRIYYHFELDKWDIHDRLISEASTCWRTGKTTGLYEGVGAILRVTHLLLKPEGYERKMEAFKKAAVGNELMGNDELKNFCVYVDDNKGGYRYFR